MLIFYYILYFLLGLEIIHKYINTHPKMAWGHGLGVAVGAYFTLSILLIFIIHLIIKIIKFIKQKKDSTPTDKVFIINHEYNAKIFKILSITTIIIILFYLYSSDWIDITYYLFYLLVFYMFFIFLKKKNILKNRKYLIIIFHTLNIIFLMDLDKVNGFPYNNLKLNLFYFYNTLFFLYSTWLVFKYKNKYHLLLLFCWFLILYPITNLPKLIIKQYIASKIVEIAPRNKADEILFFKISSKNILANGFVTIGIEPMCFDREVTLLYEYNPKRKKYTFKNLINSKNRKKFNNIRNPYKHLLSIYIAGTTLRKFRGLNE